MLNVELKNIPGKQKTIECGIFFVQQNKEPENQDKRKNKSFQKIEIIDAPQAVLKKAILASQEMIISGKNKETIYYRDIEIAGHKDLLFVGIGHKEDLKLETIRQLGATVFAALKSILPLESVIYTDGLLDTGIIPAQAIQAFTEGLLLAEYELTELKTNSEKQKAAQRHIKKITLLTKFKDRDIQNSFNTAKHLSECVFFARRLGDMPGNLMTPRVLAEEAKKAAKKIPRLKVTVWDKAKIKKERMNAFLSVNKGSEEPPKFIIMEYKNAPASKRPLCFIGKGLTFDAGGICIKPGAGMEEMKYDMCGGANTIATMMAIAKLKLKINAFALIPSTENLLGYNPNKPGDVVIARNGKSIEINNTDAEGRLILADALVYACEKKPAFIIDVATLTGAVVMALGNLFTGYFTRSNELVEKINKATEMSGEAMWRLPLTDDHLSDMKGTFADLSNMSSGKGAGSSTAAAFLEQFVEKDIPWAHVDIAGTAWNTGNRLNYVPKKGATGVMIRTLVELAKNA